MATKAKKGSGTASGSGLNKASVTAALFVLGALSAGLLSLIGLILAYVWSGRPHAAWQTSHFLYLMRTFWLALLANIVGGVLIWLHLTLIGVPVLILTALWTLIRACSSFAHATRRDEVPNALTYLF